MTTKCPACGFSDCYNSGFTIECWNSTCKFYSEKQKIAVQQLQKKKDAIVEEPKNHLWSKDDEKKLMEQFAKMQNSKQTSINYGSNCRNVNDDDGEYPNFTGFLDDQDGG